MRDRIRIRGTLNPIEVSHTRKSEPHRGKKMNLDVARTFIVHASDRWIGKIDSP